MGNDGNSKDGSGSARGPADDRQQSRDPSNNESKGKRHESLKKTLPLQLAMRDEEISSGVRRMEGGVGAKVLAELGGPEAAGDPDSNAIPAAADTIRSVAPPPPAPKRKLSATMVGMPTVLSGAASTPLPEAGHVNGVDGRDGQAPVDGDHGMAEHERGRSPRHTSPGTGPARRSGPRVQGDVRSAPVQPIGPKITISSSERPGFHRVTTPEPHQVIDAPMESGAPDGSTDPQPVSARAEPFRAGPVGTMDAAGMHGPGARRPMPRDRFGARGPSREEQAAAQRERRKKDVLLLVGAVAVVIGALLFSELVPQNTGADDEVEAAEPELPGVSAAETQASAAQTAAQGPVTRLETTPPGAEILFGGAVVASTPASLTRPEYAGDYLVRKRGYLPQLVRIGPSSPETIAIELKPTGSSEPAPATEPAAAPPTEASPAVEAE